MIKLKDILNEGKQPLNEVMFYGKAKVVLTSNAKDSQLPSQYVEFNFNYVNADYLGKGPTLICIPKSSKDLDKIDTLGSISKDDITKQLAEFASKKTKQRFVPIEYRHKEQYTIALDIEPILKKIK
tara:strand:+ start:106 stop:483 length:378 start_codon:yes stop_codon:yes gene_type:complete